MEKGGLLAALRRGEEVVFADEMRLGLLGQVRRVWGRRGEKQRRRIELRYEWVYLVLGVDPMRGRLWWDWVKRVEGRRSERIEVKKPAGEGVPRGLEAEGNVSSLVGWHYGPSSFECPAFIRSCVFRNRNTTYRSKDTVFSYCQVPPLCPSCHSFAPVWKFWGIVGLVLAQDTLPRAWKYEGLLSMQASQTALSNWRAGGQNQIE